VHDPFSHHLTEDLLEQYVLAKLPESDLEPVEEHLLTCQDCRDRLIDVERFVTTIQAAARKLESSEGTGEPAFCRYTIRRSWTAEKRL
jgi:anti-sigma factor RsiW